MKKAALLLAMLMATPATAQDYIDSQPGPSGTMVHVKQIQQRDDLMTIVLDVENTTDEVVEFKGGSMNDVYLVTNDKRFPVLTDSKGKVIGAPINQDYDGTWFGKTKSEDLEPNSKTQSWFKFTSPSDEDWPIELILPDMLPITLDKPKS